MDALPTKGSSATPEQRRKAQGELGFTLVELMIVVAIIAILSAIALPMYGDYVTRARVADVTAVLSDLRAQMEHYYLDNRTYDGAEAPCKTFVSNSEQPFLISCTQAQRTFLITATGRDALTGFVFTINQSNVRSTVSAPGGWGTSPTCWVIRKGQSC